MEKIAVKGIRRALTAALVTSLCLLLFVPPADASGGVRSAEDRAGVSDSADAPVRGVQAGTLPAYALLPDGSPNPVFTDADGFLRTVSPAGFAEIVADWENPVVDTTGMLTVLELLGHIPADPEPAADPGVPADSGPVANPAVPADSGPAADQAVAADSGPDTGESYQSGPKNADGMVNAEDMIAPAIRALGEPIAALAVNFPYFFHLAGQTDPYGSGHSYRQYYVPAGSDVPLLSFCLEMGKNAPPDSVKVAYTPMSAPAWSTALATYAPAVLQAHGIDTISDNQYRQWAMQDAVWALTGAGIGAAAGAPVIQSLIAAAGGSVTASQPVFNGISDGTLLRAEVFAADTVRYGPFSISGMSGSASASIITDVGAAVPGARIGGASGEGIDAGAVPGDTDLYVYVSRTLNIKQRIHIELNAPYVLPSTMQAFQAPRAIYQNQLVMMTWTPMSGTVSVRTALGGFGEGEVTKLDDGWRPDYLKADYNANGQGDVYRLEGAEFKIREWNGYEFADTDAAVNYQTDTRTYRTGFLTETGTNGGRFRIAETNAPYGYRDEAVIDLNIGAVYGLIPDNNPGDTFERLNETAALENSDGDGSWYVENRLADVKIELRKRDSAENAQDPSSPAFPQGGASLKGAYYGLYYDEAVTDPSGIGHEPDELVCIGVTDENGRIVFDNSDAGQLASDRKLIWRNDNDGLNYGTADFPSYLPVFERQDRRIYPARYYVKELVPSPGYLLDIDPQTAELDANGVPVPGTGTARKYRIDARDTETAQNSAGINIRVDLTEKVKKRGFLLRKIRGDGHETEVYPLDGAGFSVYLISDVVALIEKAASSDPAVKVPRRGLAGWNKDDFIDFFYEHTYLGRYPALKRAKIDYVETPVFYAGAGEIPGLSYGKYGSAGSPQSGEVIFPEFPYGEYIVFETDVLVGLERMKPFIVHIAEDGGDILDGDGAYNQDRPEQSWRIAADSDMFSIRLWKKDAETGRTIIGKDAAFRIRNLGTDGVEGGTDDSWVEMVVPGRDGIERFGTVENPFRVGEDGVLILPKKLQAGRYKLYEVESPEGYVLSYHEADDASGFYQAESGQIIKHGYSEQEGRSLLYAPAVDTSVISSSPQPDIGIVFDIGEAHRADGFDIDEDGYDDLVIELVQYNEQQKGRFNIHKEREGKDERELLPFPGVRFELYAAEDLQAPDGHGDILFEKGALVGAAVTDDDGNASFSNLFLGRYILKEADIGDASKTKISGRLVSGYRFVDQIEVDLNVPEGGNLQAGNPFYQENPVISASWDMLDTWQFGKIELHKTGEKPGEAYVDRNGNIIRPYEEEPLAGVTFEVIAAGDISDINTGEIIWKKGDVAGTIVTDEEGSGRLVDLLPGDYILRETAAPEGYLFVPDEPFTVSPREHREPFSFLTWDLTDVRQKLSVVIRKTDEAGSRALAGAVFGIFAAEDIALEMPTPESEPDENIISNIINGLKTLFTPFTGRETLPDQDKIPDGTLVRKAVSGTDGKVHFRDLAPGAYVVRELSPPPGYVKNEKFAPVVRLSYEGRHTEYLTWAGTWTNALAITVEVDKDTIRRTAAAFVSLPNQAGYNNVGDPEERYRYDIDFRSTADIWADELVVDDPLENADNRKIVVEQLWTPVVWGDYDGLWNLWYATNKTDPGADYSAASAMADNPFNPGNPDNIAVYPNTGLRLLAQGLRTDQRYHFTQEDFALDQGEYLTHLRFEYGRVEVGFTSKNYADQSLNGEHRTISGADLNLPSDRASELCLLERRDVYGDAALPSSDMAFPVSDEPEAIPGEGKPGLGEPYEIIRQIEGVTLPSASTATPTSTYITGIRGNIVDWTPVHGTRFFAPGALNPGYDLKPASYLVSAVHPMTDVDIVSSVSARIARDVTMRAYDQDAVATKQIATFEYSGTAPGARRVAKTADDYPLLVWLLVLLSASVGLLALGRISLEKRYGKSCKHKS